ncbi:MAG: hypothetical protein MJ068_00440 [Clostridia bacterium]|nr:hypothetical protein [Clostridia bacterium]
MKKKVLCLTMIVVLVAMALTFTACNKAPEKSEFDLPEGTYQSSLSNRISSEDQAIINAGMDVNATEDEVKLAVMTLYTIANTSRTAAETSLMVQRTDMTPDFALGYVSMRGFTLKSGERWFYQFAAQGVTEEEALAALFNSFTQQIQIAYTEGDGKYYYFKEMSDKPQCDCSLEVFPYATFKITGDMNEYATEDDFQAARYYLSSQLEINNMDLCKDIIADGAEISYDAGKHLYTVKFAVDCDYPDNSLLEKWYACANKDLNDADRSIKKYDEWHATMEIWDNGYVKSFVSDESRQATNMAGGQTMNAYEYIYGTAEIKALLDQDARFENGLSYSIEEYIDGYIQIANNKQPASLGQMAIILIAVCCSLVGVIVIIVVTIEVLVKKGKLPKLAEKRAKRKEKRLAKKKDK